MTDSYPEASAQIQAAYEIMGADVGHFPYSDPDIPLSQRDLPEERYRYEQRWWEQESKGSYDIGVPSQDHRTALIYAVEAAENITAWDPQKAKRLLQLAIREIDNAAPFEAAEVPDDESEKLTFTTHLHEPAHGGETGRLAQDDITAVKVDPNMTVQKLVEKIFIRDSPWGGPFVRSAKHLVIRPEIDINEGFLPF